MKVEIKVPPVGESITEAIIANIIKTNGDFAKEGDEIIEIETDKVNQVVYATASGVIELSVQKEDKVSIGQVIGFIDTSKTPSEKNPSVEKTQEPTKASDTIDYLPYPPHAVGPSARSFSKEFTESLDKKSKAGSSVNMSALPKIDPSNISRKKMSSLRKKIAVKLVEVKNTTAMLTTFNEIDMSSVMEIRAKEQENFQKRYGVKLGFMSFFVKAVVVALKSIPAVNAMIDGDDILNFSSFDIGVAVSTDKGLMVPVVKGCDSKSFGEIEKAISEFAKKARDGNIQIDDLRGGSFTITNGGTFGSLLSTPIINPPQSAILGMHAIVKRPIALNDEVVIRPMMYIALSYDHRLIDGKEAVQFLVHIKQNLEDPSRLLLDL